MKVMICVPHFYPKSAARHAIQGSSQDSRESRSASVEYCLKKLLSFVSNQSFLLGTKGEGDGVIVNTDVSAIQNEVVGDVFVCTRGDNHVLEDVKAFGYQHVQSGQADPMLLGYACRRIFQSKANEYDLFVYIEDDIAPLDPDFLRKIAAFYNRFGQDKVVLPQRYELFGHVAAKSYLEQPTPPIFQVSPDFITETRLSMPTFHGEIFFDWTRSHGSGCFAITRDQLLMWAKRSDFHQPDPHSLMDALEQAMVPLGGRYPIYKTAPENIDFLEVHHVPNRLCHAKAPATKILPLIEKKIGLR